MSVTNKPKEILLDLEHDLVVGLQLGPRPAARGHLDDDAAERPDVGRPTMTLVHVPSEHLNWRLKL